MGQAAQKGGQAAEEKGFSRGKKAVEGEEEGKEAQVVEGETGGADLSPAEQGPLASHLCQEEEAPDEGFHEGSQEPPEEELCEPQGDQKGHQGEGQEVRQGGKKGEEAEAVQEEGQEEGLGGQGGGEPSQKVPKDPLGTAQGGEDQGDAQDRQVGELEGQAEEAFGSQEELEEEGEAQSLEHPGPAEAQEEAQEGKPRHQAGPHQGGAWARQPEVEGEEAKGEEVPPASQGVEEEQASHQEAHVQAGEGQEVGQPGPLEAGIDLLQPRLLPQDKPLRHLLRRGGEALGQPRPQGGPGVGQRGEGLRPFHVKHAPHPLGEEPGPLVQVPGVPLPLRGGQVAPEAVVAVL